jgi:carboxyl-terminal processing protease
MNVDLKMMCCLQWPEQKEPGSFLIRTGDEIKNRCSMKPLIRVLIVLAALFHAVNVQSQVRPDLRAVIDTVLYKAKHTSLNAHFVSWDSLRVQMYKHAAHAKTIKDLRPGFELLLNVLDDPHGKFINAHDNSLLATFTAARDPEIPNSHQAQKALHGDAKPVKTIFEFREMDGIGYLRIASISPDADLQKEAMLIRTAIDSLSKRESQRWIVDLRYLSEGGLHPLMVGIAPLLGEGQVGGIVDNRSRITKLYEVHNGNFYDDQKRVGRFSNLTHTDEPKIAVLISRHTAGPGQIMAIALKGRKNTKFFGENTAGSLTITNRIQVTKNLIMSLSEGLYQDRIGNAYPESIEPDHEVVFEPAVANAADDKGITDAVVWLNEDMMNSVVLSHPLKHQGPKER